MGHRAQLLEGLPLLQGRRCQRRVALQEAGPVGIQADVAVGRQARRQRITVGGEGVLNQLSSYIDDLALKHGDAPNDALRKQFQADLQKYKSEYRGYLKPVRSMDCRSQSLSILMAISE